ncbi:glycosyl transferase [Leptospira kobayashii]|uniref:Glycosyl transferase n=1 Tax=Leptospira kobayashii TaxID=1917830 RepID=A0ABM7UJZ6_9LEPT|nr:glycosyltransferase family 2 protein [Leptospira kobayashii]BDA79165.1 glycosyl transferase [Leptospira kobayashii]
MPKLSIITINFNNRKGLEKTIESVRSQSWKDFEHIIIDGGSTDGSAEYLKKNAHLFSYWVSEKDNGIYHAMNKGIVHANGDYCQFLNSGDVLNRMDSFKNLWEKYEEVTGEQVYDLIYSNMETHYNGKSPENKLYLSELSPFYLAIEIINHQSQFISTKILKTINGYDETYRLASDYELFLRLVLIEKVKYIHIPVIVCNYDMIGLSSSPEMGKKYQKERDEIRSRYFPDELKRAKEMEFFQTSSSFSLVKPDDLALSLAKVISNKLITAVSSSGILSKLVRTLVRICYFTFNILRLRFIK